MADDTRTTPGIEMLLGRGEERGCVSESEIDRLAQTLELDDEGVEDFRDELSQRGIAVQDDCGKPAVPATGYANGELVSHTIDSMGQFLREAARLPADRRRGARAGQAHRTRRPRGQGQAHQPQPAARRLGRQALPGDDADDPAGPRPGGDDRVDSRLGEVRLAQGLSLLDLRHPVDPPIDPARPRHPGTDHPPSGPCRAARAQDRARAPRAAARLGHDPTDEEIAAAADLPVEQVAEIKHATRVVTRLDRPPGGPDW